jgi:hypothetical protein
VLPNIKALLAFAARFLLIFFLILPLWFVITPGYNRLLASGANILLTFTEDPHVHRLVGWKYVILIARSDSPFTEGMKIQGFTGYLTHFNLVLMTGLVLAQRQVAWRRRCAILAVALGVLFITHMLYLVIGVKFFEQPELEAFQSATGRLYVWGTNFYLSMASQLLPALIWMALYWSFSGIPEETRAADEGSVSGQRGKTSGRRKANRAP